MNIRAFALLIGLTSVVAACSGGDDDDDGASVPVAPSGLTAALMVGQPHLTWTDNSDDEDGFEIQRMITGTGTFAVVYTETFDIEQFHDTSVQGGTSYTYRVVAVNEAGDSSPSNEDEIATP
jgi:hypothetical protein